MEHHVVPGPGSERRALWSSVASAAAPYGGVLSRRQLRQLGVHRDVVRRAVHAGHWTAYGNQTVALQNRLLTQQEHWWRAVWEVGIEVAAIDGVSALLCAGLSGYSDEAVHISVLHWHRTGQPFGTTIHKVIRRTTDEIVPVGLPRVRTPIAAVRAAQWARSDRQAALLLAMTVQQRLARPDQLAAAHTASPGRRRRAFIKRIISDVASGAQSLGELDFAAICRRRGLPEPDRQVLRHGPRGRVYLDVRWSHLGLVVEIDGSQHRLGLALAQDNLRQNDATLSGDVVLRMDLLGLRVAADEFLDQIEQAIAMLANRRTA